MRINTIYTYNIHIWLIQFIYILKFTYYTKTHAIYFRNKHITKYLNKISINDAMYMYV